MENVKTILQRSLVEVATHLDVEDVLITLQGAETLTGDDVEIIRGKPNKAARAEKLLDILTRRPVASYIKFMEALKTGHSDLYNRVNKIEKEVTGTHR